MQFQIHQIPVIFVILVMNAGIGIAIVLLMEVFVISPVSMVSFSPGLTIAPGFTTLNQFGYGIVKLLEIVI